MLGTRLWVYSWLCLWCQYCTRHRNENLDLYFSLEVLFKEADNLASIGNMGSHVIVNIQHLLLQLNRICQGVQLFLLPTICEIISTKTYLWIEQNNLIFIFSFQIMSWSRRRRRRSNKDFFTFIFILFLSSTTTTTSASGSTSTSASSSKLPSTKQRFMSPVEGRIIKISSTVGRNVKLLYKSKHEAQKAHFSDYQPWYKTW